MERVLETDWTLETEHSGDWWSSGNWWESYSHERETYLKGASKIWSWKLAPEEEFPTLKGIRKFAKLLQGPGKDIVVRFKNDDSAPAYYNPTHRVVVVSYGEKWREALKNEWWPEAMAAHEIGHVRFTPEFDNFPVWNLIEDRRIEESMACLFPKLREKFRKVAELVLSWYYEGEIKSGGELAYPACVAFHWFGAEPTIESLEKATGKKIAVEEVNGHSVDEFLSDLFILVRTAVSLAGRKEKEELNTLYLACKTFQARYFSDPDGEFPPLTGLADGEGKLDPGKAEKLREIPLPKAAELAKGKELRPELLADGELSFSEAEREREEEEELKSLGTYNSVDTIRKAMYSDLLLPYPKEKPSINRGVVRRFLSFFPSAARGKAFAEEGVRIDMRRYVRGYDDIFVAPKKTPAPYCIDVVVDGSGSMYVIESNILERSYVRKVLLLLMEAEKISNLRFRVMITSTCIDEPLFVKADYDGQWSKVMWHFNPTGDENFSSAIPYLKSRTVLVITDGNFVLRRDVEAIKELAKKKALIGLYIQGEYGYPYERVAKYMENFHRFLYIKDENDLWKLGKLLARFV